MTLNKDYTEVPLQEMWQQELRIDDPVDDDIQEVVQPHFCNTESVKSSVIKRSVTTFGTIGGAALGSIPTIICIALTYLGMQLSGEGTLAPGSHDADMIKVSLGIILTIGAGFAALLTAFTVPIYGAVKGGIAGWKKGEQIIEKYLIQAQDQEDIV